MTSPLALFPPTIVNLVVMVGSRYRLVDSVTCDWETDFTGWTGRMEVRDSRAPSAKLLADLSAYVSVNSVASQVTIDIDANASELVAEAWTSGQYDVTILHPSDAARTLRVLQGNITLNTEVNQ